MREGRDDWVGISGVFICFAVRAERGEYKYLCARGRRGAQKKEVFPCSSRSHDEAVAIRMTVAGENGEQAVQFTCK